MKDVQSCFAAFVEAVNHRNETLLREVLWPSDELLWVTSSAVTVVGIEPIIARFQTNWQNVWYLAPRIDTLRMITISNAVTLLHATLDMQFYPHGDAPHHEIVKWSGVFKNDTHTWRLAAILIAQHPSLK